MLVRLGCSDDGPCSIATRSDDGDHVDSKRV